MKVCLCNTNTRTHKHIRVYNTRVCDCITNTLHVSSKETKKNLAVCAPSSTSTLTANHLYVHAVYMYVCYAYNKWGHIIATENHRQSSDSNLATNWPSGLLNYVNCMWMYCARIKSHGANFNIKLFIVYYLVDIINVVMPFLLLPMMVRE